VLAYGVPSAALRAPGNTIKGLAEDLEKGGTALGNMATEIGRGNHEKAGDHLATGVIATGKVVLKVDGMIKTASSLQKPPAGPSAASSSAQGQGAGASSGCNGGNCGVGGACFAGGTLLDTPSGAVAIEDVRVGIRVLTSTGFNETKVGSTWPKATLRLPNPWGHPEETLDIELLRPAQMLDDAGYSDNGLVWFGLGELGIEGVARVVSVTYVPYIEPGPGYVVTMLVRLVTHRNPDILQLSLKDEAGHTEELIPTAHHPLYSADRQAWLHAGELVVGERLQTNRGAMTIARVDALQPARVYNFEVEGKHTYLVGKAGIWSHNTGPGPGCVGGAGGVEATARTGTHRSGPKAAWAKGAESKSKWTQTSGDATKAVQNTVYDS
jgi:hypothetical protein